MSEQKWDAHTAVQQITSCGFECEAGHIANNTAWAWLSKKLTSGPRFMMGQKVWWKVSVKEEKTGFVLEAWKPFTIVVIRMGSSSEGLAWSYDITHDAPSAYHYGAAGFTVAEAALYLEKPEEPTP